MGCAAPAQTASRSIRVASVDPRGTGREKAAVLTTLTRRSNLLCRIWNSGSPGLFKVSPKFRYLAENFVILRFNP